MGYNGWSNRNTWAAALWMSEHEYDYNDIIEHNIKETPNNWQTVARKEIATQMADDFNELLRIDSLPAIVQEFLYVDDIDFNEIAEVYVDNYEVQND